MAELVCPVVEAKDPLPDGEVTIFRPKRSSEGRAKRRYSPRDAGRIANRAACEHGVRVVGCQVLIGLGVAADIKELIGQVVDFEALVRKDDTLVGEIDTLIEEAILVLARILEAIRRSRVLRWILRRLFLLNLVLEGISRIGELLEALRFASKVLAQARETLQGIACTPEELEGVIEDG